MFDRKGFAEYVGGTSGNSYASGLTNIESIYNADIDSEYENDRCVALLSKIESDKKRKDLSENDLHYRRNYFSHLKKYVEYRGNIDIIKQRKDFVIWMQKQPRRDDASKYYSDETINAAADKLQSGLRSLGVRKYTDINCFAIFDSKRFEELYNDCYTAAEALDKKQGHRDFRNGLEFYMQFLNKRNGTIAMSDITYWPSLEEYNPAITKEMWAEVLRDSTITTTETLSMLKKMLELGGESTCAHLAEVYGNTPGHYNSLGSTFGRRVKDKFNCPDCIDKESDATDRNRVYVIPFVGRNVKENGNQRYSWRLRDELKEALEDMVAIKEEYILTISADSVVSTDPNFTMDNLGAGDGFKPLDAWFENVNGEKIKRTRAKNERKISNQTLPRLAFQIYEAQLSALSEQEKVEYPTCQYETNGKIYKGIYPTVDDFRKQLNSIEYLTYPCADGSQFVIYAWNIFSTILFVKECLKRFGNEGDKFILTYCNKADGESEDSADNAEEEIILSSVNAHSLNTILYGPPGTGKTYNSVNYAVAIIEGKDIDIIATENHADVLKRYNDYKEQGLIAFTTFHQSYGYEEFIEGIKPVVSDSADNVTIEYEIADGIFKNFCENSSTDNAFDQAWDKLVSEWEEDPLFEKDFKLKTKTVKIKWNSQKQRFHRSDNPNMIGRYADYGTVRKLYEGKKVVANNDWQKQLLYMSEAMLNLLKSTYGLPEYKEPAENTPKVFIIDEINRGNISKIFGELITLIEDTKRLGKPEETTAILPYSGKPFGVPDNVYILGTMNTADRSIAQIDTALRRRFSFVEMMPDTEVLEGIEVEGINIANMLDIINRRIEVLYDREHTIGHAFFTVLRAEPTIEKLAIIFKKSIIPLLQEYFYEDYKKIRLVLGDNRKNEDAQFIIEKAHDYAALFGDVDVGLDDGYRYEINKNAFNNIEAYRSI